MPPLPSSTPFSLMKPLLSIPSPRFPSPASLVPHSHTCCLLSSRMWSLPRQTPLLPLPLLPVSPFIHSRASSAPYSSPILPQTSSSASGLPGLTLRPPRRSRPTRPKAGPLASADPPTPLSLRGRVPTSPRPEPSPPQRGLAPPGWVRCRAHHTSPRLLSP